MDALEKRRFGIAIQSIYYYPTSDGICTAILLKTSFDLRMGDKLGMLNSVLHCYDSIICSASAIVPLSFRVSAEHVHSNDEDPGQIDISGHFPLAVEWAEVARLSGSKDIFITPNIGVNVLGSGVGISGVATNKHIPEERSYKISLNPVQKVLANHPTYLKL
jgi:hypothetical protein